ncbi:N-acetylmannosamine-6-phosphate 2-epimerase [Actinopolymorpha pittospori]
MNTVIEALKGGLIVSCQAAPGNPLHGPQFMAAMARAALQGGAIGLRAEGTQDVTAVAQATGLPVIGIRKVGSLADGVFITPTFRDAEAIAGAGAAIIATDGTARPRPDGRGLSSLIKRIHEELALPVMADVDSVEAGDHAQQAGADVLATTLSGYTGGLVPPGPDIDLLRALVRTSTLPVIAEGRYWTPESVVEAAEAGAHAVVVGTAITNPLEITRRFAAALDAGRS